MEQNELFHKYKADELRGEARERYDAYTTATAKSTKKLVIVSMLMIFAWMIPFVIFAGSIEAIAESDLSFVEIFTNVPALIYILIGGVALAAVLSVWWVFAFQKNKRFNAYMAQNELPEMTRLATQQFDLPNDSQTLSLDILQNIYRNQSEKAWPAKEIISAVAYKKGDGVYFVHFPYLLKVPCDDCKSVQMVENKLVFNYALPSFDLKDPEIKQYGIARCNNNNNISQYRTKYYGNLTFHSGGVTWELCVLPHHFEMAKKMFNKS